MFVASGLSDVNVMLSNQPGMGTDLFASEYSTSIAFVPYRMYG